MKQNPSQGIHEYNLDDVYTPGDANARRERIHFDFVVTAEQLERYKLLHPGTIDVGNLILSNKDGTTGVPLEHPLGGPISILIDAHTTEDDVFDFYNSRIISGDQIFMSVVTNAWNSGYNGDILVHFYTRDPYSITFGSTSGGIAYHSTPEAYVNIKDATGSTSGWDGVCKVGVCKVEGTFNRYGREGWTGSSGLTLIYEKCISGQITWEDADTSTRPKDNTVPGAICAPWMSSDVDCEISVTSGLLHKYGIYNRIKQAYDLGATPAILAKTQGGLSKLRFVSTGGSDSSAFFAFEGDGKRLVVGYNDSLTWGSIGGSSSGGRGTVVVMDLAVNKPSAQAYNKATGSWEDYTQSPYLYKEGDNACTFGALAASYNAKVSVYRPGIDSFITPKQDMGRRHSGGESGAPDWYNGYSGFSFDDGEVSTLDWYTWYALSDTKNTNPGGTPSYQELWYTNPRNAIHIEGGSLKEGVVYEINIHIIAPPNAGPGSSSCTYSGKCASPLTKAINGSAQDSTILGKGPQLEFVSYNVPAGTPFRVLPWGQTPGHESSVSWLQGNYLLPCFHAADTYPEASHNTGPQYQFYTELAWAKVRFVVLQGNVYIMAY